MVFIALGKEVGWGGGGGEVFNYSSRYKINHNDIK